MSNIHPAALVFPEMPASALHELADDIERNVLVQPEQRMSHPVEITLFESADGPLTKTIQLDGDRVVSGGSTCKMASGTARRMPITSVEEFAERTSSLAHKQAWAMGALRDGLPDEVRVITKQELAKRTAPSHSIIARTTDFLVFRPGRPALMPIDFDTKGMPPPVAEKLRGGLVEVLADVLPSIAATARVMRRSTSAGLRRTDTGEECPGSSNMHLYLMVADGADIGRALRVLHDRCWLAGLGWMMVGAAGQLLERSIVDRMVGMPERLIFEGPPVVHPPLCQDPELRRPIAVPGGLLDTRTALPDLNAVEVSQLERLQAIEAARVKPEASKRRAGYVEEQTAELVKTRRLSEPAARAIVIKRCDGVLLPDADLPWDDDDMVGVTAGDVLRNPQKYEGCTLADPLEGLEYGRCKARVMIQYDGTPLIHSFAHGAMTYRLQWDYASTHAAIMAQTDAAVFDVLKAHDRAADFTNSETKQLCDLAASRSGGIGKRAIEQDIKVARKETACARAKEERVRALAVRKDPRPQIKVPAESAERLPVMTTINEVLGKVKKAGEQPPMRGYDGYVTQAQMVKLHSMHAMTTEGANAEEEEGSRLPAPEQLLLHRLSRNEVEELIERHIEYIGGVTGFEPVCLPDPFINHYMCRSDEVLPTVAGVVSMPLVLEDGMLMDENGLDRDSGLLLKIPQEMLEWIPKKEACTKEAIKAAMDFLTDEWLCDVLADYQSKCVIVAVALTLIERSVVAERPVFFITAGRRGGGKTTTILMIVMAVLGVRAAAAAWSPNEEERRKALLSYFLAGVAYVIWDNIPLGSQVFCPHIERSCTALYYVDRKLGVTETPIAPSTSIQIFTGNNIGPRGDLTSRSLEVRLEADTPDPENRTVKHQDPVGWTEANRGKILQALYTTMLGNPALGDKTVKLKTRFKAWWRLVGSAVENAARVARNHDLDFTKLFAELEQEQEEEENASLEKAIQALRGMAEQKTGEGLLASDITEAVNNPGCDDTDWSSTLRSFLFPGREDGERVSSKSVGKSLKKYVGNPINISEDSKDKEVLTLKTKMSERGDKKKYYVHVKVIKDQEELPSGEAAPQHLRNGGLG